MSEKEGIIRHVLLHGYFMDNLGDDLFFRVIALRYPKVQFTIPLLNTSYKIKYADLPNVRVVDFYGIAKYTQHKIYILPKLYSCLTMKRYDAVVCIGGSLFMDRKNPTEKDIIEIKNYSFISDWKCAYKKGVPYYVLGANWGPVYNDFFTPYFTKAFSTLKDICFRDSFSYNMFKSMSNVRQTSDILLNNPIIKKTVENIQKKSQVAISVIEVAHKCDANDTCNAYEDKLYEIISHYINMEMEVVLLSFCKAEGDEETIERVYNRLPARLSKVKTLCYPKIGWRGILQSLAESQLVIASRFHATVLGWTVGTPVFSLYYSDKTLHLLEDFQQVDASCSISDIAMLNVNHIEEAASTPNQLSKCEGWNKAFAKLDEALA